MDNQQPRGLRELCINAKLGDGYYWRHPECKNYKLVFTSTTPELLELKRNIFPEAFPSGVVRINYKEGVDYKRFDNAKPIYRLASVVHPLITAYKHKERQDALIEATLNDLALWYLDDGSIVYRQYKKVGTGEISIYPRPMICIGDLCNTPDKLSAFTEIMQDKFGVVGIGAIRPNNSKATENNKTWVMAKPVWVQLLPIAKQYGVLLHKFPEV